LELFREEKKWSSGILSFLNEKDTVAVIAVLCRQDVF
jgi:hypothetical protein